MDMPIPNSSLLYLSDARGVYIPRDFATDTRHDCVANVSQKEKAARLFELMRDHQHPQLELAL